MVEAYIGLGSNLDDPVGQLRDALAALAEHEAIELCRCSRLYGSTPMGPQDQPDYVNAVACIATDLEPIPLLDALQAIENQQGRVRQRRWGERTLDLDLILYGDQQIDLPRLQVPHYGMHERAFVLLPLAEIAPADLMIPGRGPLARLLDGIDDGDLWPLESAD